MDRLIRRAVLAVVVPVVVVFGGCGDDDAVEDAGGIDVPEIPGTFPAAIPSAGFGIAIPEGWQATVLTEDALGRLEEASLARPSFLEAATQRAESGAVFYAAGVDDEDRVAELEIDVQDDVDTTPASLARLAAAVVESGRVDDAVVVDDVADDDRVRVDYRIAMPSAEDGEPIDASGSQLFVADGDRVWSLIVTSEDSDTQSVLLQIFETSLTFD